MTWQKKIVKSDRFQEFASFLAALTIKLTYKSIRWTFHGDDTVYRLWDEDQPFIAAFWHGRLYMIPGTPPSQKSLHALISRHSDGKMIARTVARLGITAIAGSTGKGGSEALRAMHKVLDEGGCVGITPDGPRGPRMRAQVGAVVLAKRAGVPIVPLTFSVSRAKIFDSWDRFMLAFPFAKGVLVAGAPITVPANADEAGIEAARQGFEDCMNDICRKADGLVGRDPIEPAPVPVRGGGADASA